VGSSAIQPTALKDWLLNPAMPSGAHHLHSLNFWFSSFESFSDAGELRVTERFG
jgi:hypothetical protein